MNLRAAVPAILVCALVAGPAFAAEGQCAYEDLMPEFFAFRERTATLDARARARLFVRDFVPAHAEYYATEVFGDLSTLQEEAARLFEPDEWPTVAGYPQLTEQRMHEMGSAVDGLFARARVSADAAKSAGMSTDRR